ncbi:MAG: wax ester/triacylglycerol synthase domain-containing protein [Pseudomonadota bacterium]
MSRFERLNDQAAALLAMETAQAPLHDVAVALLDGELSAAVLCEQVAARIHRLPRYRQKLAFVPFNLAHPVWIDEQRLRIENHVYDHTLLPDTSLSQAMDYALKIAQTCLPREKPLWTMHLIHGVPGMTLFVHIAHQSMLDGVNINDVSQSLYDLQAQPRQGETAREWYPRPDPNPLELAADAVQDNTTSFAFRASRLQSFSAANAELVRRATESVTRFVSEPVVFAPWNRHLVGPARIYREVQIATADLRRVQRRLGGTLNDLVLAVLVEAIARFTREGQMAGRHLRIMQPVSVRREDEDGARGNRVAGIFPVFTLQDLGLRQRHQQVRWENESIKQNREAQALQLLSELAPPVPSIAAAEAHDLRLFAQPNLLFAAFNPLNFLQQLGPRITGGEWLSGLLQSMAGFNLTVTHVPGSAATQYLCGHAVTGQRFLPALLANLGFGVAVSTYGGKLTYNLLSDPVLLPQLGGLAETVATVWNEFEQLTMGDAPGSD